MVGCLGYHSSIKQPIHSGGKHEQVFWRILTPAHGLLGRLCSNLSCHCWRLRDRRLWFPDSKTMLFIARNYRVGMGILFTKAESSASLSFKGFSTLPTLRYMSNFSSCGTVASLSIWGRISHDISHFQKPDFSLTSLISLQWKKSDKEFERNVLL